MTHHARFDAAFAACPLVAILRGVRPEEAADIGEALADAGFTLIEVPLNSPNPLASIERLARRLESRAVVGAGTVLDVGQVDDVAAAGGTLIVSPNTDLRVIAHSAARRLVSLPGILTPTEAFAALDAGADALKLFPAEMANPTVLKALLAVLPQGCRVLAVGGIASDNLTQWRQAGARGFGIGSALYKPGLSPQDVAIRACAFVDAWQSCQAA